MLKQNFAVLQIGSSTLHLTVGRRGVADTFIIAGEGKADYTGYEDGRFCDPDKLVIWLKDVVLQAEMTTSEPITKLYVGVPTDFCRAVVGDAVISFDRPHRINMDDVDRLYDIGNKFKTDSSLHLINKAPIFYTTDNDRKLVEVLNIKTLKLGLKASYVYAESDFIDTMNTALSEIGIGGAQYLCTALAEMQFLFDDSTRVKPTMLIDIGGGNTSVIIGQGDGLLSLASFACGGAFLTADLSMCFQISYEAASQLKSQVVLSLDAGLEDKYSISFNGKARGYSALDANSIITDRLNQICELIQRIMNTSAVKIPPQQDIYLTGGGLLHLKGGKDYIAKRLERNIVPVAPSQPLLNKPECSQDLSLLDLALDINSY